MLTASPSVQKTLFSSYQLNYIIFAGCKKGDRLSYQNGLSPLYLTCLQPNPDNQDKCVNLRSGNGICN